MNSPNGDKRSFTFSNNQQSKIEISNENQNLEEEQNQEQENNYQEVNIFTDPGTMKYTDNIFRFDSESDTEEQEEEEEKEQQVIEDPDEVRAGNTRNPSQIPIQNSIQIDLISNETNLNSDRKEETKILNNQLRNDKFEEDQKVQKKNQKKTQKKTQKKNQKQEPQQSDHFKKQKTLIEKNIQSKDQNKRGQLGEKMSEIMDTKKLKKIRTLIKTIEFTEKLMNGSQKIGKYRDIGSLERSYLDDIADATPIEEQKYQFKKKFNFQKLLAKIDRIFDKIDKVVPVLDPHSRILRLIQSVHALFIVVLLFFLPIEWIMPFRFSDPDQYGDSWKDFVLSSMVFTIFNIMVEFNSGYYEKGEKIIHRKDIYQYYFQNHFIYDCLTIWPQVESYNTFFTRYSFGSIFNFFIFFQMINWNEYFNQYEQICIQLNQKVLYIVIKLVRLVFMVIFIAHLFAILFLGIGNLEVQNGFEVTWMDQISTVTLSSSTWDVQYIWSFYWSVTTMTTVGYGDISANTKYEALFLILALLFACMFFSYTFGIIGMLLQKLSEDDNQFMEELALLSRYFQQFKIPEQLRNETRNYLEYKFREQKSVTRDEIDDILKKVSPSIQEKLIQTTNLNMFQKNRILKDNFSIEFLQTLALNSKTQKFESDTILFHKNDDEEQHQGKMYLIESGCVDLYQMTQKNKETHIQVLKNLTKGDSFGEFNFLFGINRTCNARTISDSNLIVLEYEKFKKIIKKFPKDYERLCMMKEKIIFNNDWSMVKVNCFVCNKYYHNYLNCPRVHFTPDQDKVLQTYLHEKRVSEEMEYKDQQQKNIDEKQKEFYFQNFWKKPQLSVPIDHSKTQFSGKSNQRKKQIQKEVDLLEIKEKDENDEEEQHEVSIVVNKKPQTPNKNLLKNNRKQRDKYKTLYPLDLEEKTQKLSDALQKMIEDKTLQKSNIPLCNQVVIIRKLRNSQGMPIVSNGDQNPPVSAEKEISKSFVNIDISQQMSTTLEIDNNLRKDTFFPMEIKKSFSHEVNNVKNDDMQLEAFNSEGHPKKRDTSTEIATQFYLDLHQDIISKISGLKDEIKNALKSINSVVSETNSSIKSTKEDQKKSKRNQTDTDFIVSAEDEFKHYPYSLFDKIQVYKDYYPESNLNFNNEK